MIRSTKILPGESRVLATTIELFYRTPIFSQCTSPERINLHPIPVLVACGLEFPAMIFSSDLISVFLGPYPGPISRTMFIRCSSQHYSFLSLSTQLNNLNHRDTEPGQDCPPPHKHPGSVSSLTTLK